MEDNDISLSYVEEKNYKKNIYYYNNRKKNVKFTTEHLQQNKKMRSNVVRTDI